MVRVSVSTGPSSLDSKVRLQVAAGAILTAHIGGNCWRFSLDGDSVDLPIDTRRALSTLLPEKMSPAQFEIVRQLKQAGMAW